MLWQVVVLCGPDGKRHTLEGVIDNLLQSLDSSMEISDLMSQKEVPEKKKRVVGDSSSSEEKELSSEEEEEKAKKRSDTKKKQSKRSKVGGSKGGESKAGGPRLSSTTYKEAPFSGNYLFGHCTRGVTRKVALRAWEYTDVQNNRFLQHCATGIKPASVELRDHGMSVSCLNTAQGLRT